MHFLKNVSGILRLVNRSVLLEGCVIGRDHLLQISHSPWLQPKGNLLDGCKALSCNTSWVSGGTGTMALKPTRNKGSTLSHFLELPSATTQFLSLFYCPFSMLTHLFCLSKHMVEKHLIDWNCWVPIQNSPRRKPGWLSFG